MTQLSCLGADRVQYVRVGGTGLTVSRICLGMMSFGDPGKGDEWMLTGDAAEPLVRRAVDAGITFFDTADMYSSGASEEVTGRLLGKIFPRRDDYVLATKVFFPMGSGPNDGGLSRKHTHAVNDRGEMYRTCQRCDVDDDPCARISSAIHQSTSYG